MQIKMHIHVHEVLAYLDRGQITEVPGLIEKRCITTSSFTKIDYTRRELGVGAYRCEFNNCGCIVQVGLALS